MCVCVSGVSEENINKLFLPYSQIDARTLQQGGGTGVGLTICKEIVTLHGGTIGCKSKLRKSPDEPDGGGSEFFFIIPFQVMTSTTQCGASVSSAGSVDTTSSPKGGKEKGVLLPSSVEKDSLPAQAINQPAGESESESSAVKGSTRESDAICDTAEKQSQHMQFTAFDQHDVSTWRFIVFDDVLSNRKMLNMLLSKRGISCDQAENGLEGLKIVDLHPINYYHLVFMDNLMPVMNGLEATKALRDRGFTGVIIGLTGNAMNEDIEEFESHGADMVLPKPLKMTHLDYTIKYIGMKGMINHRLTAAEIRTMKKMVNQ